MPLRDRLLAIGYAILSFLVALRAAWLGLRQRASDVAYATFETLPRLRGALHRVSRAGAPRGSPPRRPTVLGAVLVRPHQGAQDDQALSRLFTWYVLMARCISTRTF